MCTHSDILEGEWISNIVGLKNVHAKYAKMESPNSETSLELIEYYSPDLIDDPHIAQPNGLGFRHMALKVGDIEEIVQHLKKEDVKFFSDIIEYPTTGKKLVYFSGPDNEVLELAQYP